ncbi:MAG: GlsB/YeaQ/YmgE family stress response membrane protein [Pseudolabrys sp.]|nr:GlsB/YeaQ/YmgE family stress response membrane protein [Pseudolabrys sp.]
MSLESLIILIVVGAIAGWLAGMIVKGGGYGLIGDIIVGIVGAFIGGWVLGQLGIAIGGGIVGSIINATIGAVILLLILRLIKRA